MFHSFNLDHIGIAVENLDTALFFYVSLLGLKVEKLELVPDQKVKVAFLNTGHCHLELLEPTDEDSPVAGFLKKRGPGIHHIALRVKRLDYILVELAHRGVKLIDKVPRRGADGKQVAFIHPYATGGVLLELCEPLP